MFIGVRVRSKRGWVNGVTNGYENRANNNVFRGVSSGTRGQTFVVKML